jgi:hypothetical protein
VLWTFDRRLLLEPRVPLRGVEPVSVTAADDKDLQPPRVLGAAESGAFYSEVVTPMTVDILAKSLLALSPEDFAKLAALLQSPENKP